MSHPFEDPDGSYLVLVNDEEQHSLWPASGAVPAGWRSVLGPESRAACLAHVEASWRDMRPKSLIATTGGAPAATAR
ncbi:MbtH family protein [Streptomyces sp. NPDC046465]|uniref:MbtH family protein n=1 Tax=Streptomyces sp. NPDC046465 TaxID=3155810 RepID=UPI0033FE12A2